MKKKIIQFDPGRVVFAINLQSSLSWNFDYAGIRQATDCGLSPSSPLSSLLPPAANRKQMSLILRGMAILPFFSSQLTISWEEEIRKMIEQITVMKIGRKSAVYFILYK